MTQRAIGCRAAAALLSLVVAGGLAACSSDGDNTAAGTPSGPGSSAPTESAGPTESASPTSSAITGTATDFCGAFKELRDVQPEGAGTLAEVAALGARFRAAAADMKKFAPAEIKGAVETYAGFIDAIGQAAMGGAIDETTLSTRMQEGLTEHPEDIGTVAVWVAQNCQM